MKRNFNDKGVSEIVSYVLLIIIAIGISIVVYNLLKVYLPKDKPECKDGVNIIIKSIDQCSEDKLLLTIKNRGRFKVNGAFVRIGNINRDYRKDITGSNTLFPFNSDHSEPGIYPGESIQRGPYNFDIKKYGVLDESDGLYLIALEVQPFVYTKRKNIEEIGLCPSVKQTIKCSAP